MIRVSAIVFMCIICSVSAMDYPCYKLKSAPIVDGKLNDPSWTDIPSATGFKNYGSGGYALRQNWFKAGYTNDALFIALDIREEDFASALLNLPMGDRLMEFDNCIHIKINSPKLESIFTVNAANSRHSKIGSRAGLWNNFSSAVVRGKDNWQLEIKIPFGKNLAKPKNGEAYQFFMAQYCRNNDRQAIYAPWGDELLFLWGKEAFVNRIVFHNITPTSSLCKKAENKLNGNFFKYLNEQLKLLKQTVILDSMWLNDSAWQILTEKVKKENFSSLSACKLLDVYYKQRNLIEEVDSSVYKQMLMTLTE